MCLAAGLVSQLAELSAFQATPSFGSLSSMADQLDIHNVNDILCVGATKLGVLTTLVMAEYWPNKRFVITDKQAAINRWQPNNLRVFEPGLPNILAARTAQPPNGNVTFEVANIPVQVNNYPMIIVATEVKTKKRGIGANRRLNLASWDEALRLILTHSTQLQIIVMKCALPHNMSTALQSITRDVFVVNALANYYPIFWIPEFFSAGTALANIRHPSRVVISQCLGHVNVMNTVADFYRATQVLWVNNNNILLYENHASAAIGTMGVNVMLAFKATVMQILTKFCDSVPGGDAAAARNIMTADPRIGDQFLDITAGIGGGAILRDLRCFKYLAELTNDKVVADLIDNVIKCNEKYKEDFVAQILHHLNALDQKVVIILGFSYKPNTSDMDNSAAIHICQKLCLENARIRIYDSKGFPGDIRGCFSPFYTQGNNPRITVHQNIGDNNNQLWQGANAICFLQNSEDYNQLNFVDLLVTIAQPTVYLFDSCGALGPLLPAIQDANHLHPNSYRIKFRGCQDMV